MRYQDACMLGLTTIVATGFFVIMGLYFLGFSPKDNPEFSMLAGGLASSFGTVVQFWLGSSVHTHGRHPGHEQGGEAG